MALLDPGEDDGEADRVGEAEDLALLVEEGAEMVDLPLLEATVLVVVVVTEHE